MNNNNILNIHQKKIQEKSLNKNHLEEMKETSNIYQTRKNSSSMVTISTHNVRGVNKITKQDNILEEMKERNIDILGISETKLAHATTNFVFNNNPNYKCFTSSSENKNRGNGVAIIITKKLEKHVERVTRLEGHIIAIHMLFKENKLCIIQVYLPNDKSESIKYQKALRKIIGEEIKVKTKIIVMGDFNATSNPKTDRPSTASKSATDRPEAEIFDYLTDWEFTDIQKSWEEEMLSPTWYNQTTYSRIDYIWTSPEIALENLHSFKNEMAEEIANSDHTLLSIKLYKDNLINNPTHKPTRKKGVTKVINIKNTSANQWKNYSEKVNKKIDKFKIDKLIDELHNNSNEVDEQTTSDNNNHTTCLLDNIWENFKKILITSAYSTLKVIKIKGTKLDRFKTNKKGQEHSPEFKKYRESLKLNKAVNKAIESQNQEDLIALNELIEKFNNKKISAWPINQHHDIQDINMATWISWKKDIKETIQMLKEESIRIENQKTDKSIKEAIIQRCANLKESPGKMISSLTNQHKSSVYIDRIVIKQDGGSEYISTDPAETKKQVENYYTQAFGKRKSNFQRLSKEWKKEYRPKDYINSSWFDNLLKQPSNQELDEVLKELPNNKAPGPSGISYEMIKNLKGKGRTTLRKIFSICMIKGKIPNDWKKSNIYPIPKKEEWNARLHNTRPIVLMETVRKCFTKIVTNRLSTTCKSYQILRGPNFAGLPGESTQEPIQLLNSICEEAREEKKELWILLQDTAKAFDTVNLEMLEKALLRIKIPEKAITLILSLFHNRQFKVITAHGLTETIQAGDGIDQGETISPLLWRIFYDPLLCKIQNNSKLGYKMECTWNPNLNLPEEKTIKLRNAAMAYMDDTTWIAHSKENMQLLLEDAREFYKANDSQINSLKSVLIVINSNIQKTDQKVQAGLNKETVQRLAHKESARFLGVWIGDTNSRKDVIRRIQNESTKIINALKWKKATEKQVTYIFNRVLMPRIEYRIQHCHIPAKTCDKLTTEIRRMVRNKLGISNTTPNSILHHKGIIGLKSIWEIQTESHITNLVNRLNDIGPAGTATIIRLKQAQINNWEPTNILEEKIPESFNTRDNLAASTLKMANDLGIKFENNELKMQFQWQGGNFTIKKGIDNNILYKNSIPSLKKRKLMYIDQLIDSELGILLSWNLVKAMDFQSRRGPEPNWYKTLRQKITVNNNFLLNSNWRTLSWQDITNVRCSPISQDKRIKEWCCKLSSENKIIWGKIIKKEGNIAIFNHYEIKNTKPEISELTICKSQECTQGSKDKTTLKNKKKLNTSQEDCILKTEIDLLTGPNFLNKPRGNNKIDAYKIPGNVYTLEKGIKDNISSKTKDSTELLKVSNVVIENWESKLIDTLVISKEHKNQLTNLLVQYIKKETTNTIEYEFYTDGSLSQRSSQEVKMGAAWIQTSGPIPGSIFKTGLEDWPSSSRAEVTAIATALLTVPQNRSVKIYTDSQNCIDTYTKLISNSPKLTAKRWLKINNWSLWSIILEAVKSKKLKLTLVKVKAHSNDPWNERADKLAKEAASTSNIKWSLSGTYKIQTIPKWMDTTIDMAPRNFIKEVNKIKVLKEWTELNRIQSLFNKQISDPQSYEWRQLWKNLKKDNSKTSNKNNKKRGFLLKLMHNELPTLDNLAERRPDIYHNFETCPNCMEEKENREHLFQCKGLKVKLEVAWNKAIVFFKNNLKLILETTKINQNSRKEHSQGKPRNSSKISAQVLKIILNEASNELDQKKNCSKTFLLNFSIGLLDTNLTEQICNTLREHEIQDNKSKIRALLICTSNNFRNHFRKEVWNFRCEKIVEADNTRNVTSRIKRKKKSNQAAGKKSKDKAREEPIEEDPEAKKKIKKINKEDLINKIGNKIHDWIKQGSKWLGII